MDPSPLTQERSLDTKAKHDKIPVDTINHHRPLVDIPNVTWYKHAGLRKL